MSAESMVTLGDILVFLKILFIFRERGREGEREGEKHRCVVASGTPLYWGPDLQPSHMP